MPRKTHPFAQVGRPKAIPKVKPVRLPTGEVQGAGPSDGFRSNIPAQTYAKGGPVKYHDDPSFKWGSKKKGC